MTFGVPPSAEMLYVTDPPCVHHVLLRFTLDSDFVDPASEAILLEGDHQAKLLASTNQTNTL